MGIKKPPAYVHPRKRASSEEVLSDDRPTPKKDKKEQANRKKVEDGPLDQIAIPELESNEGKATVLLRLVARVPETGQIPLFDQMIIGGLSPKDAILGIWKREFEKLVIKLRADEFHKSTEVKFSSRKPIETTRKIKPNLMQTITAEFDPFGILTDRALGQRIGEALISQAEKEV